MATAVDIVVNVLTKLEDAGVDQAQSKFGKMGAGIQKAMVPAVAAIGVIGAFGAAAVDSASRLEQAIGATDSVFGRNAAAVKKWSDTSATAVGLAKSEYLELSTVLGAQLKNMGVPMKAVAGQTKNLVGLGADLAATFGGTTSEAVEALSSLLRGETDPIERYGVSIKEADIAAQMAADGTAKLEGEQKKAAKTQAILKLLTNQTADAQGAFARESDTAAHAQQVAAASYEDAKAALGTALLPAVAKVMDAFSKLATMAKEHPALFQAIIAVVLALAAAVVVLNVAMLVVAANPIALAIAGIVAVVLLLIGAFVMAYKKCDTFRAIVDASMRAIKSVVSAVASGVRTAWNATWDAVSSAARTMAQVVSVVFNGIRGAVSAVTGFVRSAFDAAWNVVESGVRGVWGVVQTIFGFIRGAVQGVAQVIRSVFDGAWNAVENSVRTMWGVVQNMMSNIRGAVSGVAGFIRDMLVPVWGAVQSAAATAFGPIAGIINGVKGAISGLIGQIQSLIGWLGRIKVPNINLPNIPGFNAMAPVTPPSALAAVAGAGAPRVSRAALAAPRAGGGNNVYISVTGAIDPESTARQIRRILNGHDRRVGLA